MSAEGEDMSAQTQTVDVDCSVKEVDDKSEVTCDSGLETLETCSASVTLPVDMALSMLNGGENDVKKSLEVATEYGSSDTISSPRSLSPEEEDNANQCNKIILDNLKTNKGRRSEGIHNLSKGSSVENIIEGNIVKVTDCSSEAMSFSHENGTNLTSSESSPEIASKAVNFIKEVIEISPKSLKTSTMSLNEDLNTEEINKTTLNRTMFSRSVENVSSTIQAKEETVGNASQDNLNAEKIISDFTNQKYKASATQKIVPDAASTNPDLQYLRLPKELLHQDLGSIYKNVHGIFSTVSGSLKNAYNISQRASTHKPVKPQVCKPVLNTNIINEIFEEDPNNVIQDSGVEKPDTNLEQSLKTTENGSETDSDVKTDVCRLQVETLERLLAEQRKEMAVLRERMRQQADELQEKDETFKDFEGKMDLMRKSVEQSQREKDAAVMRYASSECQVIEARRAADAAAQRERAAAHELDLASGKLKSAHSEKQRICQLYDDKCHELLTTERELARCREEGKELEGRLKWTQNRLRSELEAYKSSAERVESLQQRVTELESGRDSAAANAADSLRAKQLESELKEAQATLILCRHESTELERRVTSLAQQLATCERERDEASGALARATAELERLRASNLALEEEAASLAGLGARAALADSLGAQLDRERSRAAGAEAELAREQAARATCGAREAAALQHAALLTARHARAAAAAAAARQEASALCADNEALRARTAQLERDAGGARAALAGEGARRERESRLLARKVAELTEEVAELNKKLEWEKGENGVLKKKHSSAIKELNRELQRSLKRCEQLEAKMPHAEERETRAGSVSSVSSAESAAAERDDRTHNGSGPTQNGSGPPQNGSGPPQDGSGPTQNGSAADPLPDIHVRSADRQALIERIVSLQRAAARRAERCDFLEEHAKQLTDELRRKSRALRQLLCGTPAGALAGAPSDRHKRDIARLGGGAMAAVWGGDAAGMTLELSLEMNTRLQAVLEDTLLKNITLKENMDTLGKEISKLKAQKAADDEPH